MKALLRVGEGLLWLASSPLLLLLALMGLAYAAAFTLGATLLRD